MTLGLIFILGLAIGSFVNVLIDRLPRGESVVYGRSKCDYCGKTLRWYELIPVFSWIIQRGRCLRCHKPLSPQYPGIELITAIGLSILYLRFPNLPSGNLTAIITLLSTELIFIALEVIFMADLKYQIIPDSMVILGLLGAVGLAGFSPVNLVIGVAAALFFFLLYLVTRGKGMGLGDVKFAFLMGYLAGFPGIIVAIYIAFLTGAAVGVILILEGKKKLKSKISFGPFLVLGLVIALIWGDKLSLWFLKMF